MLVKQLKIYSRSEWGAKPPISVEPMDTPVPYLSLGYLRPKRRVKTLSDEMEALRELQHHQMEVDDMPDIQSNFLIGMNGTVYEGRGWSTKPSYGEYSTVRQRQYRGKYLEITFIANYLENPETNPLLKAASDILKEGLSRGMICKDFIFLEQSVKKYEPQDPQTITVTPNYPLRRPL